MTDKIEETIKEIAAKHGIAVGLNDPILILHTMNERLMQESKAAQQANLDAFKSELEAIAHQWDDYAKNKAERTLNAALVASKEAMSLTIKESAKTTTVIARQQIEEAIERELKPLINESQKIAYMNIIAAGMTVFAACLILFALW